MATSYDVAVAPVRQYPPARSSASGPRGRWGAWHRAERQNRYGSTWPEVCERYRARAAASDTEPHVGLVRELLAAVADRLGRGRD